MIMAATVPAAGRNGRSTRRRRQDTLDAMQDSISRSQEARQTVLDLDTEYDILGAFLCSLWSRASFHMGGSL
jgi:hypothetical protein